MEYKPSVFAEMIGVSVKTLQRWDKDGKLKAYRSNTDRRYYTHEQYLKYKGIPVKSETDFNLSDTLLNKLNDFAAKYETTNTEILETLISGMDIELVIGKSNVYEICKRHRQNIDNVEVKELKDLSADELKARIKLRRLLIREQDISTDSSIYKDYVYMKNRLKELEEIDI